MAAWGPRLLCALALVAALPAATRAQSNYANHANNVEYQGGLGLPEEATLDGRVTRLDDLSPVIALNRTRASLNCASGSMQVELKFKQPFFGLAYADFHRNSACQVAGNGDITYTLELSLKGCGTVQEPQRVFTNNIVVRFHPGLEMDGDEIITIVCRYPPPVAPAPAGLPARILTEPAVASAIEPPLKGFHILLIICAILFLSLLLLGLSLSYVCLKKRQIRVVRRAPLSGSGTGSEITKLSGSSLGNLSMFEGLRIPRAHAPPAASMSGSEAQLILAGSHSDTIPSDYPSESPSSAHSEVEDVDTRSLRRPSTVSSAGSYDNKAFAHTEALSSFYSEGYTQRAEALVAPPPPPEPRFDVHVRVKKAAAPPPPPTPPPSDVESMMSVQARNLTTILEREEVRRAVPTPPPPPPPQVTTFSYAPELHPPPAATAAAVRYAQTPPVYSRILRKQQEHVQTREPLDSLSERSIPDNDNWSQAEDMIDAPQRRLSLTSARSLTSLNTEMTDTRSMSEIVDTSHQRYATSIAPPPPPPPPIAPTGHYTSEIHVSETADMLEPPVVAVERRPEITTHIVDDVFLKTITEKRTIEDVERHRRQVTEYHARQAPPAPNPKWDVVIRNYPDPNAPPPTAGSEPGPDWESYSEASSVSGVPTTPIAERHRVELERSYRTTLEVPMQDPPPPNWDVLIRVLNPPEETVTALPTSTTETFRTEAILTVEDREKWRQIITTESTLRTLLTEATVREDFERIRHDQRYERLFEPHKWDVIIRVLAPPMSDKPAYKQQGDAGSGGARYRRKADWDTRSRRSSLPTLYEYDSDGGSSVRTLVADPSGGGAGPAAAAGPGRSRRTSRSSLRSDMDVRSMTEVTVDFARSERADTLSDASGPSGVGRRGFWHDGYGTASDDEEYGARSAASLVRSASQPSLARSASEFTEHWAAPSSRGGRWEDDDDDLTSPEHSPRSGRSRTSSSVSQPRSRATAAATSAAATSVQVRQQMEQKIQQHLATSPPPAPGVAREVVITATTSSVRETYERGWFGDGDSDASFK